ncbi:unnamed protein product [Fusarium graminearum]|uniref:Chromosome 3, complete genome n=1 Tax=Gibberella zeae (strain ATCC MYA-4620 / CBS 123657 / FGSC 9075 / NRRL 31084 / PH-1) TaxID=229533 RepID=A0A098E0M3_GIBZE|nr:unnamed protein product [Fusarium graminearum]
MEIFATVNDGAKLVNTTARSTVNKQVVIQSLKISKISAAGLDVPYHERQRSKDLRSRGAWVCSIDKGSI